MAMAVAMVVAVARLVVAEMWFSVELAGRVTAVPDRTLLKMECLIGTYIKHVEEKCVEVGCI